MGLGLAIVAAIVEAHGGHVGVETGSEQGTTFRVVLPRAGRPEIADLQVPDLEGADVEGAENEEEPTDPETEEQPHVEAGER